MHCVNLKSLPAQPTPTDHIICPHPPKAFPQQESALDPHWGPLQPELSSSPCIGLCICLCCICPLGPFLQPLLVPLNGWTALQHIGWFAPPSLVLYTNLTRPDSTTSPRSSVNMFKWSGLRTDPCSTLLLTSIQVDYGPLPTALWAWPPSRFFTHLAVYPFRLSHPNFNTWRT